MGLSGCIFRLIRSVIFIASPFAMVSPLVTQTYPCGCITAGRDEASADLRKTSSHNSV
jgi:hypothetical protein